MDTLPLELLDYITKYLCIVDRMSLKFTCEYLYYNIIDLDIKPFIVARIQDYVDADEFLELINYDTIISGSFLLACLYDEWWFDDIDIYEYYKTVNETVKMLAAQGICPIGRDDCTKRMAAIVASDIPLDEYDLYRKSSKLTNFLANYLPERGHDDYYSETDRINITWSIKNFTIHDEEWNLTIKFQRILIQEPIREMIFYDYDLDIVRNYYDGTLHVSNWDALINRTSFMKPVSKTAFEYIPSKIRFNLTNNRRSYESDPFNGIWIPHEFLEHQSTRALTRKEKYEDRGFTIIPIDNFEIELLNNYKEYISRMEFFDELNIDLDALEVIPIF